MWLKIELIQFRMIKVDHVMVKESSNCKMGMRGTVKCSPTVVETHQITLLSSLTLKTWV